ncbi:MAG: class I SAM-dependent methyltransferase, partial [Octadecabacter sp.]|nr:class I SAM-dependent methyltransferase [Octadecabacter sp.]
LHHLPDPAAGFAALRAALAPGGGLGFMVYAPYGRSGVYPLQQAFGAVLGGLPPAERLAAAREMFARIPEGHPFKRNPHLGDHLQSDAGFYDLLLHSQDRAFDVPDLLEVLGATGWALSGLCHAACYDLRRYGPVPEGMDHAAQMAAAEKLSGAIKVHVGYAVAQDAGGGRADPEDRTCVPHLVGVPAGKLAQAVALGRALPITAGGDRATLSLPAAAAPLIAGVNGRRSLAEIAKGARVAGPAFGRLWAQVDAALEPWGLLLYSDLLRKV